MDYNIEIEKIKQELITLGFTQEKIEELLKLALEEITDIALVEIRDKDITAIEEVGNTLSSTTSSPEEVVNNIATLLKTAYGENSEEARGKLMYEYLLSTLDEARKAKDLVNRYQAGDPTAVATINANKDDPEVQEIINTGI